MTPEQKQWWDEQYAKAQSLAKHWSTYEWDTDRWPNFSPLTDPKLYSGGNGKLYIEPDAMDKLQALREEINRPINLNSAYRDPVYNAAVGGSRRSMHMLGIAFDISTNGHDSEFLVEVAEEVGFNAIGLYSTFIHVDDRPWRARW